MNKNDSKAHRSTKGLVDPKSIKEYPVYHENTLLEFLYEKMGSIQSKKNIKRILANHQVSVGGVPVTQFDYKIYPEDSVVVSTRRINARKTNNLPIIYEDNDVIAIDKPSGLLSVATEREKGRTAYRLVSDYVSGNHKADRIFVVHRLDEDTSGVLLFAKSFPLREALQIAWQSLVSKRGYYAIVEGEDIPEQGILKDYLALDKFNLVYVTKNKSKGKLAITNYRKIASKNGYSLLDVTLESGRKNQIRVQLGNIGHFVIGDDKYGEPSNPLKRLGLHAYELDVKNPLTGQEYHLSAPMPLSFQKMFFNEVKEPATLGPSPKSRDHEPIKERRPSHKKNRKRNQKGRPEWTKRKESHHVS